jgi:hypothetical protein
LNFINWVGKVSATKDSKIRRRNKKIWTNSAVKSLKLPFLDGEQKKFQIWWTPCMVYAGVFGLRKALTIN